MVVPFRWAWIEVLLRKSICQKVVCPKLTNKFSITAIKFAEKDMENYKLDTYWFLGFLGFVGFYKLTLIINCFYGQETFWELLNVLWFSWFLYFIPKKKITL